MRVIIPHECNVKEAGNTWSDHHVVILLMGILEIDYFNI